IVAAYSYFLRPTHRQVRTNEGLQIAIEYAIHIADFFLGPVILHHAVGLQHVGPDLRSEIDVELRVLNLLRCLPLLLQLQLVKLCRPSQRRYMRSRMARQSCESTPRAPA